MALLDKWTAVFTVLMAIAAIFMKRVFLDDLSRYPGPKLWAFTRFPYFLAFRNGTLAHKLRDFHARYGEVIRVAPNELSYIRPDAIREIYAKRPNTELKTLPKDQTRQPLPPPGAPVSILEGNDTDHSRIRKGWASSFSAQSLAAQEPLINDYVVKMISQLTQLAKDSRPIDLQAWYSYCTFDIITSLSFGEDLQCTELGRYHEWVALLVHSVKAKVQIAACRLYPLLYFILMKFIAKKAQQMLIKHQAFTSKRVQKRLATPSNRADFFTHFQKHKTKEGMSDAEIELNAATMVFAGSHTLQSALTGITLQLLNNPDSMKRVVAEVRSRFTTENDINYKALSTLPYLNAVIQEGMRLTSPVPLGLTRMVPEGGSIICGDLLPGKTIVSYQSWAANTSPRNFSEPTSFRPERWLEPGSGQRSRLNFPYDRREAMQPFLQGPRDCLGQNLAKVEILLIVGRMLYHFDMAAPGGTFEWEEQETYAVWMRTPLPVELHEA